MELLWDFKERPRNHEKTKQTETKERKGDRDREREGYRRKI
jgi:hypothetical protein